MLTGILLANGTISASILSSLFNENLVKEGGLLVWECCGFQRENTKAQRVTGAQMKLSQKISSSVEVSLSRNEAFLL